MLRYVSLKQLRQLKLPLGVTRIPASAVRDLLKRSDKQPRTSKYHAVRTEAPDGRAFSSRHEAARYWQLKMLEKAGEIGNLELQPVYHLHVNGVRIGEYRGDFRYERLKDGEVVTEDAKGLRLALYKWKKRHTEVEYGIRIIEV